MKLSDDRKSAILLAFLVLLVLSAAAYSLARTRLQSAWTERKIEGVGFLVEKSAVAGGRLDFEAAAKEAFGTLRAALGDEPARFLPPDLLVVAAYGGYGAVSYADARLERAFRGRPTAILLVEPLRSKYAPNEPLAAGRTLRDERIALLDLYVAERNGDTAAGALVHALSDFIVEWNVPAALRSRVDPGALHSPEARRELYLAREAFSFYLGQRGRLQAEGAPAIGASVGPAGKPALGPAAAPGKEAELLAERYRGLLDQRYAPEGPVFGGGNLRARFAPEAAEVELLVENHYVAAAAAGREGEANLLAAFRAMASGGYEDPRIPAAAAGASF